MSDHTYAARPLRDAVVEQMGGGTPSRQVASYWKGDIPWASVKDFPEHPGMIFGTQEHISLAGLNASASNLVPARVPLVCTRMAVGRSAMSSVAMAINQDVRALFPAPDVSPSYLLRLLEFVRPKAEAQAVGSTVKGIRIQDYLGIEVPIADPPQQSKIAEVLDTLDTAIHETEALIAKLKAVKQGLLHDLLTRGIDANGELRPPQAEAPYLYKSSPLGWIPFEWSVRRLDACASIAGGVTLGRDLAGPSSVELPYLRVANVQDGYFDLASVKKVRVLTDEIERYKLMDGDVLMNEGGDYDKLGRGAVWRSQIEPCLHQNHVFRVRCDSSCLDADFLAFYTASAGGKRFFLLSSKQSTNLASINLTQLKAFPIPCPKLNEQRKIVAAVRSSERQTESEELQLSSLRELKAGLMDDLLTGRVRVTPLLDAVTA